MRKTGRKQCQFDLTEKDCVFVYKIHRKIQQKLISKKEGSDILSEKYGISIPTIYKIFTNMYIMELLMENDVSQDLLAILDKELKVLDIIKVGKQYE